MAGLRQVQWDIEGWVAQETLMGQCLEGISEDLRWHEDWKSIEVV